MKNVHVGVAMAGCTALGSEKHRTDGHHPRIFKSLTSPSAAGAEASAISTSLVSSLLLIIIALGSPAGSGAKNDMNEKQGRARRAAEARML